MADPRLSFTSDDEKLDTEYREFQNDVRKQLENLKKLHREINLENTSETTSSLESNNSQSTASSVPTAAHSNIDKDTQLAAVNSRLIIDGILETSESEIEGTTLLTLLDHIDKMHMQIKACRNEIRKHLDDREKFNKEINVLKKSCTQIEDRIKKEKSLQSSSDPKQLSKVNKNKQSTEKKSDFSTKETKNNTVPKNEGFINKDNELENKKDWQEKKNKIKIEKIDNHDENGQRETSMADSQFSFTRDAVKMDMKWSEYQNELGKHLDDHDCDKLKKEINEIKESCTLIEDKIKKEMSLQSSSDTRQLSKVNEIKQSIETKPDFSTEETKNNTVPSNEGFINKEIIKKENEFENKKDCQVNKNKIKIEKIDSNDENSQRETSMADSQLSFTRDAVKMDMQWNEYKNELGKHLDELKKFKREMNLPTTSETASSLGSNNNQSTASSNVFTAARSNFDKDIQLAAITTLFKTPRSKVKGVSQLSIAGQIEKINTQIKQCQIDVRKHLDDQKKFNKELNLLKNSSTKKEDRMKKALSLQSSTGRRQLSKVNDNIDENGQRETSKTDFQISFTSDPVKMDIKWSAYQNKLRKQLDEIKKFKEVVNLINTSETASSLRSNNGQSTSSSNISSARQSKLEEDIELVEFNSKLIYDVFFKTPRSDIKEEIGINDDKKFNKDLNLLKNSNVQKEDKMKKEMIVRLPSSSSRGQLSKVNEIKQLIKSEPDFSLGE